MVVGDVGKQPLGRLGQRQAPIIEHVVLPRARRPAGQMVVIRVLVGMQSRHIEDGRSDAHQQSQDAGADSDPAVAQQPLGDLRAGEAAKRGERR